MPHRDLETEERPCRAAQRQGKGNRTETKDSTSVSDGTEANGAEERKSTRDARRADLLEAMAPAPSPWRRLAEVLEEAGADPLLREFLEAGRHVDAEEGDGAAAILPGGETLLLLASPDGLLVRRNVTDAELHLFLAGAREAA